MSQEQIRVGVAGLGRSGWGIHVRLLSQIPAKYQIVAVTDPDAGRCQEAVERFGCQAYAGYDELVGDDAVELVVVATPSHLHADYTIAALEAGKAVVCEKPMAASLADADRMIAAAEHTGRLLTIFQNRRYSPDFCQVKEVIDSGVLGRIVMIHMTASGFGRRWDWQTLKRYGGGSLNNTGVHFLDQALQLFGPSKPQVYCHMERTLTLGDAEDHVKLILRAEGAQMIDLEISSAAAYPFETWNVMGTQGGLAGSRSNLRWKYIDPSALLPRSVDTRPTPDRSYNREDLDWREETWDVSEDSRPSEIGYYLDLYQTIRHGAPLVVTPESVRRVMQVLEECHRLSPV